MDDEDRQHLFKMLQTHQANLRQLKEQAAQFGIRVPLDLHNSIVHEETQITRIKEQLTSNSSMSSIPAREPQHQLLAAINEHKTVNRLRVFLCHSSEDKPKVRNLYQRLQADGFDPWLDEENILPGQDWNLEIRKAVRKVDVVVVCLSHSTVTKAGFVHKEIKLALDVADEQPEGAIFIIPVKLEKCEVPERIQAWHWIHLFEERSYEQLRRALQARWDSIKSQS
jgi:hypothetical protein